MGLFVALMGFLVGFFGGGLLARRGCRTLREHREGERQDQHRNEPLHEYTPGSEYGAKCSRRSVLSIARANPLETRSLQDLGSRSSTVHCQWGLFPHILRSPVRPYVRGPGLRATLRGRAATAVDAADLPGGVL